MTTEIAEKLPRSDKGRPHNRPLNRKEERFAVELYSGKTPVEAFELAGYGANKGVTLKANARRMSNDPRIRARIREMFDREWGLASVQAEQLRHERRIIAYADMKNYFHRPYDDAGNPTGPMQPRDITQLPRHLTAAIKSIRYNKTGFKIELHSKEASLQALEDRYDPAPDKGPGLAVQVNVNTEGSDARERLVRRLEQIAGNHAGAAADEPA